MSDTGGGRTTTAFGIDSLVDADPLQADRRPAQRRDLHWWVGGGLLVIALPMLAWQARDTPPSNAANAGAAKAAASGSSVRPPETTNALDRTIDDQTRVAGPTAALPPLPPLPAAPARPPLPESLPFPGFRAPDGVVTVRGSPSGNDPRPSRQEQLAAEQERRLAEARSSPLLALGAGGGGVSASAAIASSAAGLTAVIRETGLATGHAAPAVAPVVPFAMPPADGRTDVAWLEQARTRGAGDGGLPVALRPALRGPVVLEGTVIPAVLLTEVNSDLPGTLVAQVTQDIWDSVHGTHLLIPMGSRLVGDYSADVRPGQERVLAAFRRLILPDGASLDLLGTQATDAQGRSGLNDRVDRHFWTMFGSSFVIAALASLVQRRESQPPTVVVVPGAGGASGSAVSSAAGSVLVETSRTILGRSRNISPTLLIGQGHRFSLTVQRTFLIVRPETGTIEKILAQ